MAAPSSARKGSPVVHAASSHAVSKPSGLLQPTRVSLLQRGQSREQFPKQNTIVKAVQYNDSRRDLLRRVSSKRLSATAFTRSMKSVLAAGDDHLDELLKGVSDSINFPEQLPRCGKDALILQAVLGLWLCRQEARGFRRWKDSTLNRVDLQVLLAAGVDVHEEARQLLLTAETKRRLLTNERRCALNSHDDDGQEIAANFSYAEMDLLLAWARYTQPNTFREVDDNTMREALRYLRFSQYQDGDAIFFQGDKGDVFYLVLSGSVGIYGGKRTQLSDKQKHRQTRGDSATKKRGSGDNTHERPDMNLMGPRIFTYRAGESFGETALFTNAAVRTATAIASGAAMSGSSAGSVCELCQLSRAVYSRTLKKFHQHIFTQAQRVNFTQRIFLFRDWPRVRVVEVAEVLELRRISFGGILLTEGVSPLEHCFFVLSGSVTITTQLEISSHTNGDPPSSQSPVALKKARRRTQFTIELHTVRVGEIVALEALLEDDNSAARVAYTAVGGSADVEVYALKRTDGRAFLTTSIVSTMHQIQSLCESEHTHRKHRIDVARRALSEREAKHRLELANEALALEFTDQQQHKRKKQQEPGEPNQLSNHDMLRGTMGLQRPFLPHLDPVKLLVGVDETKTAEMTINEPRREIEIDTSLGDAAVPPKMLSTLVRNFIIRDGDALADDYAQRLTLRLPVRNPLSPLLHRVPQSLTCRSDTLSTQMLTARRRRVVPVTMSARFHDERLARDSHLRGLSMNHDAKMHWDPDKKTFVLLQAPPAKRSTRQPQETRAFKSSNAVTFPTDLSRPTEGETTGEQHLRTKLHYQLQTAQISARKLSEEHTRTQDERSNVTRLPSTFVHFF